MTGGQADCDREREIVAGTQFFAVRGESGCGGIEFCRRECLKAACVVKAAGKLCDHFEVLGLEGVGEELAKDPIQAKSIVWSDAEAACGIGASMLTGLTLTAEIIAKFMAQHAVDDLDVLGVGKEGAPYLLLEVVSGP